MDIKRLYQKKTVSVDEVLKLIRSGNKIVLGGELCCPVQISKKLHTIAPEVDHVMVFKDFSNPFDFARLDGMAGHIETTGFFFGADMREGLIKGNSTYFPSDLNSYVKNILYRHKPDIICVTVTAMDETGWFHLAPCDMWEGECLEYALENDCRIIVETNKNMPVVSGGMVLHIKDVSFVIESDLPLREIPRFQASETERAVARNVRSLMKDGDCVQFGIGSLPDAIARECMDLQDLGMHTEMVTSAMGDMIREGVITGERKNFHRREHIFTFAGGDQALYDTLGGNPCCRMMPACVCVDPFVISQNDHMVSVNTLVQIDLTGQICSESVGSRQISGSGGALNFVQGALKSKGGRSIMAFTSRTSKNVSKIVPTLNPGAVVTVPRNYADYVVTEYGCVQLRGRSVRERTKGLISVAHPDDRKMLEEAARKMFYI